MIDQTKILIVDDREENLIALEKLLQNLNIEIVRALSGNEALQQMIEYEFALVLMDIQMPEMDGFETVQIMRDNADLENTPVIFISAIYKDDLYNIKGIESGAIDFIVKPIIPEVLIGKVQMFIKMYENRNKLKFLNDTLKKSEESLKKSKETLIEAQRVAKIGNFTIDLKDGRQVWSEEIYRIYGLPPKEYITLEDAMALIHPDDRNTCDMAVSNAIKGKTAELFQYRIICPDGKIKWLQIRSRIVKDNENKPFEIFGTMQDITAQKESEDKLQQAEKLQVIGQLAGGIAHDFNNQLASIMGNTELAIDELPQNSKAKKRLENILTVSKRAADLTWQLLAYARKGNYVKGKVEPNKIISEVISILRRTIDKKITIIEDITTTSSLSIYGDPTQIYSAILNIGINARDAIQDSGHITFKTFKKSINNLENYQNSESALPGEYIVIEISDTGMGIKNSNIEKIFDPFFTTKEQGKGTGMGLSAVQGIVMAHDGIIDVSSSKGKGTTFFLYFPIINSEESELETTEGIPQLSKFSGTVLLADDEEMICDVGTAMLNRLGFKVLTASNGAEAIKIYEENHDDITLVILDVIMPIMDGEEALTNILKINKNTKIIISTGFTREHTAETLLSLGAKGILKKPFKLSTLNSTIKEILDS